MGFLDWALNRFGYTKLKYEAVPAGTIEKEFGVLPAASRTMADDQRLWWQMYVNHPPWALNCDVKSLGLPGAIGRELSRHALTEFAVAVSGSARAGYIDRQLQLAAAKLGYHLELGLCLGGVALRPYPDGKGRILVDTFTTGFVPTRFDGAGKCTGGVFKSRPVRQGKDWFVKLEYHDFLPRRGGGELYVVENRAFKSGRDGGLGAPVPLGSVEEWSDLEEHLELENLESPLFAYFKPPMANHVDPDSPLGVSVYSGPVASRIQEADEQWEQLKWEYRSGQRRIILDRSAVNAGQADDRLFELGSFNNHDFYQLISPEFRNSALYEGYQYILKVIEFNCGLAFGTISDPQAVVEKTATAELIGKHEQYITVGAIQRALQDTLDDLTYAMSAWCDLARLAPAGTYTVDYSWGDGVLDDPDTRRQDMAMGISLMDANVMGPVEFRMKYFREDEKTAKKMLPKLEELVTEPEEEIE